MMNIPGHMTDNDFKMLVNITSFFDDKVSITEVGCLYGRSSVMWANACIQHNLEYDIHCMDSWAEDEHTDGKDAKKVYEEFTNNIKGYNITHEIMKHNMPVVWYGCEHAYRDIVFYDACHKYHSTLNSLEYWSQRTKYLVIDDLQMEQVRRAINAFVENTDYKLVSDFGSKVGYIECSS